MLLREQGALDVAHQQNVFCGVLGFYKRGGRSISSFLPHKEY